MTDSQLPSTYFRRLDETEDALFYAMPRKVVHIDAGAIAAVTALYGELLPPNAVVLDLMSSWRSHLPSTYEPAKVIGLGMNAEELRENPQLTEFVIHNLNQTPRLPFAEATFDAVICTVSIQYLIEPILVCREVYRVLKPDGLAIFTFSNLCFSTKAIAVWKSISMQAKANLVAQYLRLSGFADIHAEDRVPETRRTLFNSRDPLIGVWGYKNAEPC
jgi:SAM-dependent methyltransferase